jgi:hypothetical protein
MTTRMTHVSLVGAHSDKEATMARIIKPSFTALQGSLRFEKPAEAEAPPEEVPTEDPGTEKTDAIEQYALQNEFVYIPVIASLREPADFLGLPTIEVPPTEVPPTEEAGTAAPPRHRSSTKDAVLHAIVELSTKVVELAARLDVSPDNEEVTTELQIANRSLLSALNAIEQRPADLGIAKRRKGEVVLGATVCILAKHQSRYAFLNGAETRSFVVASLNGRQVGVTSTDGTIHGLYIPRSILRLV